MGYKSPYDNSIETNTKFTSPKKNRRTKGKGRSSKTYVHKICKMTKIWDKNKTIQKKYTKEEWLDKVKKSNTER